MLKSSLLALFLAASLTRLGCHAQTANPGNTLPPKAVYRLEVTLRQHANLPPASTINVSALTPSGVPGFSTVFVTFTNEGNTSHPVEFLISDDYKTLEQVSKYDLSKDPRTLYSLDGRPGRGGPETAPVLIVGFDDLECPFCAKLHATIFPAVTNRYGDKVHIIYKDYPLADIHPWAKRAAIDVNCLAAQSPEGYWTLVDTIHAHASQIASDPNDPKAEKTMARAEEQLDKLTHEQGVASKVDLTKLDTCVKKQDPADVDAMIKLGTDLKLESTPILFINGMKVDGAVPIEYIFGIIDSALNAQGVQPPPAYVPASAMPVVPGVNAPSVTPNSAKVKP